MIRVGGPVSVNWCSCNYSTKSKSINEQMNHCVSFSSSVQTGEGDHQNTSDYSEKVKASTSALYSEDAKLWCSGGGSTVL